MSHKVLEALLKKARSAHKAKEAPAGDPCLQLILAALTVNTSIDTAERGLDKLLKGFVDTNELRMSLVDEMQESLGANYPQGRERLTRLTEALNDLFAREHQMDMASLKGKGKREQREYLDTLRGLTRPMAAQVFALAFEGHAVPVDERTLAVLKEAGALEDDCDLEHAENVVTRAVKAGEAIETFLALNAFVEAHPPKNWPQKPAPIPVFIAPAAPAKGAVAAASAVAKPAEAKAEPAKPAAPIKPAVKAAPAPAKKK